MKVLIGTFQSLSDLLEIFFTIANVSFICKNNDGRKKHPSAMLRNCIWKRKKRKKINE